MTCCVLAGFSFAVPSLSHPFDPHLASASLPPLSVAFADVAIVPLQPARRHPTAPQRRAGHTEPAQAAAHRLGRHEAGPCRGLMPPQLLHLCRVKAKMHVQTTSQCGLVTPCFLQRCRMRPVRSPSRVLAILHFVVSGAVLSSYQHSGSHTRVKERMKCIEITIAQRPERKSEKPCIESTTVVQKAERKSERCIQNPLQREERERTRNGWRWEAQDVPATNTSLITYKWGWTHAQKDTERGGGGGERE